jgi:hypothetical protein
MRRKMLAGFVAIAALAIPAAPAMAVSPEQACIDSGGTYDKVNGLNTCTYPVGQSDNTKVTDQQGSWSSDGGHDEGYTNPNGNEPPGKQGGDTLP